MSFISSLSISDSDGVVVSVNGKEERRFDRPGRLSTGLGFELGAEEGSSGIGDIVDGSNDAEDER
jgi:hypothetical protein